MSSNFWYGINAVVNIFQSLIMTYFVFYILGSKNQKNFIRSGAILYGAGLAAVRILIDFFKIFDSSLNVSLVIAVFLCIFAVWCLNGSYFYRLFISVLTVAIGMTGIYLVEYAFSDLLYYSTYSVLATNTAIRILVMLIEVLILLYLYYVSAMLIKRNKATALKINEWLIIASVLIMSIVISMLFNMIATNTVSSSSKVYLVMAFMGIVIINLVTIYLVTNLSEKNRTLQENELLKIQQKYQQQYVENAKLQYDTIRKMRHDFKNNYGVLEMLIKENNNKKALEYINSNLKEISKIAPLVRTDNDIVNAVINSKAGLAKKQGIEVSCLTVREFKGIDDLDLSNLLGNLFDNAIKACEEYSKAGVIELNIKESDGIYNVNMKNTVENSVLENNPLLNTTKSDKKNHGLGTKIIKDIADKYSGICDFYEENGFFCCNVILKSKNKN